MRKSGSLLSSWLQPGRLRWLAVLVAAALVVTVVEPVEPVAAAPTVDVAGPDTAPGQAPETGLTAPDEASARLTARLRGKRVEVLDARTEFDTTYAKPDGSLTWSRSTGQVRFRRGEAWVPVDLALVKAADGSVAPKGHPHGLRLSGGGGAAGKVQDLASLGRVGRMTLSRVEIPGRPLCQISNTGRLPRQIVRRNCASPSL